MFRAVQLPGVARISIFMFLLNVAPIITLKSCRKICGSRLRIPALFQCLTDLVSHLLRRDFDFFARGCLAPKPPTEYIILHATPMMDEEPA